MANSILIERMGESWYSQLSPYLESSEFSSLGETLEQIRSTKSVFPEKVNIFRAFKETPLDKVRVVWLGQDPYPTKGDAIGVSFGINNQRRIPPSLMNIRKEMEDDLGIIDLDFDFSLLNWCRQGVLMLNTALTVEEKNPGAHLKLWKNFTKEVFKVLNDNCTGIVFVLLGKQAQDYKSLINLNKHHVVEAPHPAAESYAGGKAGFFGSKIFSKVNSIIEGQTGPQSRIIWSEFEKTKNFNSPYFEEEDPF